MHMKQPWKPNMNLGRVASWRKSAAGTVDLDERCTYAQTPEMYRFLASFSWLSGKNIWSLLHHRTGGPWNSGGWEKITCKVVYSSQEREEWVNFVTFLDNVLSSYTYVVFIAHSVKAQKLRHHELYFHPPSWFPSGIFMRNLNLTRGTECSNMWPMVNGLTDGSGLLCED